MTDYVAVDKAVLQLAINCLERDAEHRPVRAEIVDELSNSCKDCVQDAELNEWMRIIHDPKMDVGNRLQAISNALSKYVEQPTFENDERFDSARENHPTVLQMLEKVAPHVHPDNNDPEEERKRIFTLAIEAIALAAKARGRQMEKQAILGYLVRNHFYVGIEAAIEQAQNLNAPIVPLTRLGPVLNEGLKISIDEIPLHGFDVIITNTVTAQHCVLVQCLSRPTAVNIAHTWAAFLGTEFQDSK